MTSLKITYGFINQLFFKKVYLEKVKGHNMSVTCETKKSF